MDTRPFFIGISGGTGSGKSYLSRLLRRHLGEDNTDTLEEDAYYRDLSHLSLAERAIINFDHPDAIEGKLLCEHLDALARGDSVPKPEYDFSIHTRTDHSITVSPKPYILVEGILLQALDGVRPHLDFAVYLDVPADIRFIRRLERDRWERGRTTDMIISQYLSQVRPMHEKFVAPCSRSADLILHMDYDIQEVILRIQQASGKTT